MINNIRRRKKPFSKRLLIPISLLLSIFFLILITIKMLLPKEVVTTITTTSSIEPYVLDEEEINRVASNNNSRSTNTEYTPDAVKIMGYEELNIKQAHSWILSSLGDNIENTLSILDLNGLTLEEHLENLNTVSKIEDVNPNLVLVQQIKETGYFTFRTNINGEYVLKSVLPSYYNFAGLGAVDNKSTPPEKFQNNMEGQLAQVQHLKGYATTDDMNAKVVDNRLKFIGDNRGSVTTAADLSKKWASDPIYGQELAKLYSSLINHNTNKNLLDKYSNKVYGPLPKNNLK